MKPKNYGSSPDHRKLPEKNLNSGATERDFRRGN